MKRRITISFFMALIFTSAFSQQSSFSAATDIDLQRNFKKGQQYWAIGSTINALFHVTPKESIYVWFAWYSNGEFSNRVTAPAKSPFTIPNQVSFTNSARMKLKQFSVGYRKYLKGSADGEDSWNIYAYSGFGLIIGSVENIHSVSPSPDTTLYAVPVFSGRANFKRLTLDLGLGYEFPLGGDFYFYAEGKVWIPTTDYPSKHIVVNDNAPLVGMLCAGVRVLF